MKTGVRAAKIDATVKESKPSVEEKLKETPTETIETNAALAPETEMPETPAEVVETETAETPAENKPFAAQNDEEQSGTKMADDAKIDKVEELERQ